jgi:hypothetical protein
MGELLQKPLSHVSVVQQSALVAHAVPKVPHTLHVLIVPQTIGKQQSLLLLHA